MTSDMLTKLNAYLDSIEYGKHPLELYEPIRYIMQLGGKRMRPILCLLAYSLYRKDIEHAMPAAAAVEVFHNFTLMHDDIMDQAPIRRGQATVHEKWNSNVAILSGDVMLVRAYDLLLATDYPHLAEMIKRFNQTAAEVCEGQQIDMNFESCKEVSVEQYLDMIRLKTAVLLGYSLWSGAKLAFADAEDCEKLYEIGVAMGIGFQLTDDLLDVYADQEKFGKQQGGDIVANKKTYLLIRALQDAHGEDSRQLHEWLDKSQFDKSEKVKVITTIYDKLNIQIKTQNLIHFYFDQALQLAKSLHAPNEGHQNLIQYMESLIAREQ